MAVPSVAVLFNRRTATYTHVLLIASTVGMLGDLAPRLVGGGNNLEAIP
jgi:hypothetical protein